MFRVLLVVVTVGSFAVQVARIRRHGAAGVSESTWIGLLMSTALWSTYGVAISDWTVLAANIPNVPVAWAVVHAMARAGHARTIDAPLAFGATLAAAVVGLAVVGPDAVGLAGSIVVVGRIVPQLVEAVRADDVAGVSVTTWLGNVANKVPWSVYGLFLIGDVWLGGSAAVAVVLSLGIVAVVTMRRRREAVPAGA